MKSIRNWDDLRPYGIDCLTGEACGYGYRLLCDVTDRGVQLIQNCLEIESMKLREPWNSSGIASVMLPPQMLTPLAVFALFDAGCTRVFIMYGGTVCGVDPADAPEHIEEWIKWNQGGYCEECSRYGAGGGIQFQYGNAGYSRHRHVMTGRTR